MGQLPTYKSFSEKAKNFSHNQEFYKIDTVDQFDAWYSSVRKKTE